MGSEAPIDSITFEKALRILSPKLNAANLYKILSFIRKSVEWPKHKKNILQIYKSGCIKKLLACLSSGPSNIIAVCLSILGNCCLEPNCSQEVAFTGLNDLYNLLQRCSKDDSVNGRVFRILGNLGQHYITDYILKARSHILTYILNFIQNYVDNDDAKVSEATLLMSVRAVSKFLNKNSFPTLVDTYEMLKVIGGLFIKCCMKWTNEEKDKAILEQIIKFFFTISKYRYSPGIYQLRNTSKGDCLMYLSRVLPIAPQTIVNIVMNFIPASTLKSELPIPDITAGFVKLLKEASLDKNELEDKHKDYIKCLCFLLDAPINRDPGRCDDTIPLLIKTLSDVQEPNNEMIKILCLILKTFERCVYHQNIMMQQLKHDIVAVLINRLEMLLGSRSQLKIEHKKETKRIDKASVATRKKQFWDSVPDSSDEELDASSTSLSPFRPSSPNSGSDTEIIISPWASPRSPTPTAESSTFYLQESDSEDYSPVCSENEDEDNIESKMNTTDTEYVLEEKPEIDTPMIVEKISEEDWKFKMINHSLSLLRAYSNIKPLPSQLCSDSLIMILVKCACYFDRNSKATTLAKSIIIKILSVNECLVPLMQTDVIYDIFALNQTDHGSDCEKCSHFQITGEQVLGKFTDLIESGGGKGAVANRLIRGEYALKRRLALAVPYIARFRSTLRKLMIDCGALQILIDCLRDITYRQKCVEVICVLEMKHLKMKGPEISEYFKEKMILGNYELPESCKNVVTFELDDNSCLSADKDVLCVNSCFFNTLLNGSFKESNQGHVKLKETNYHSLKYLMYLLNSDLDMSEPKDIQLETSVLLDVILLCHRFLLDDLFIYLIKCVKQFCLSSENLPIIYKWSIQSRTNILRLDTVTFALKEAAHKFDKITVIMKMFDLGYSHQFIKDIRKLVRRHIILYHND